MDKEQIKKNYLIKVKEYKDHNKSYYDESNPKIPDSQYDKLKNEILNLEKTYKFLNNKNSPSKSVGYKASNRSINISTRFQCYLYLMHSMRKICVILKRKFLII